MSDVDVRRSREGLGDQVTGELGNFYWLETNDLPSEVHTHIYRNRIGFFGQHTVNEINYVLSRVRFFS